MEKAKLSPKQRIKTGIFSGLLFAFFVAAFDYIDGTEFSILKFGFNLFVFGGIMAAIVRPQKLKK